MILNKNSSWQMEFEFLFDYNYYKFNKLYSIFFKLRHDALCDINYVVTIISYYQGVRLLKKYKNLTKNYFIE